MTTLYRFFDETDRLLYVGISDVPESRCKAHRAKPWWAAVATARFVHFEDRRAAELAELNAIDREAPVWNRQSWNAAGPSRPRQLRLRGQRRSGREGRLVALTQTFSVFHAEHQLDLLACRVRYRQIREQGREVWTEAGVSRPTLRKFLSGEFVSLGSLIDILQGGLGLNFADVVKPKPSVGKEA